MTAADFADPAALDAERRLALSYVPATRRATIAALWALDARLGAVVAAGREPTMTLIRLAWWREALAALPDGPPPEDPVLAALRGDPRLRPLGPALAEMEVGWAALAGEPLDGPALDRFAADRGARLFALAAAMLAPDRHFDAMTAGKRWALVDLARRSGRPADVTAALAAARALPDERPRWPAPLRSLGMFDALARRDLARPLPFEPQGAPARMLRMARHRITGR